MSRDAAAATRARIAVAAVVAFLAFGVVSFLHLEQRDAHLSQSSELAGFRTARLDVVSGFSQVLGAMADDSPFDHAQGRTLLAQGLDELQASSLGEASPERDALDDAIAAARAALEALDDPGSGAARLVSLRVAVGRLETLAGGIDADAELALARADDAQDALFEATLVASALLLGLAFLLLWRTLLGAEAATAARDEAESRSAQSVAREKEVAELLRDVVERATDAIFVKDEEGRYRLLNSATARVFGRSADEVVGRHDTELWDEASAAVILEHDADVLRGGVPSTREEHLVVGGEARVYLATKAPRFDASGRVVGLVGISRDVTERLRLEAHVRQSQKMEAIGRLAGGVAHDFNNLLTVINSYAELLLDEPPEDEQERRETLGEIREAGRRATALTQQLLAFSRKAMTSPRTVDVNEAVRNASRLLRRLLGEDVALVTPLCPDACIVRIDPTLLDQVVVNLGVNGRDAMPRGGTLSVSTAVVAIDAGPREGRWVELAVSDTGVGMTPEVRARIFEPFFTTKAMGKGTGLGLSVIDGIVGQAGGHVEVVSEPDRGSTFRVRLPVAAPEASVSEPEVSRRASRGHETILLVEDDEAVRALARTVLEGRGYRVLVAGDGEAALAVAGSHEGALDLLLSDVVMPRLGGRELANRLREARPGLRTLFMSGYTDDAILRHGVAAGRDPFLAKPFTPEELTRAVRDVLDGAHPGSDTEKHSPNA